MPRLTIAIAGDYGYIDPLETLIKSIVYNNQNVKIYLINPDIPQEWFFKINHYLTVMDSHLVNQKIDYQELETETPTVHSHINQMTFARLLIPRLIKDDKVLYLDADTVVNGSLTKLFQTDLDIHPVGATKDVFEIDPFNAGVLLFNNRLLRGNPHIVDELLAAGQQPDIPDGDQTVLNHFFQDSFLPLGREYNYEVGYDRDVFYKSCAPNYDRMMAETNHPIIYHFASADKPWNLTSAGRNRNLWWQYFDLDWSEIVSHSQLPNLTTHPHGKLFTFTRSDQLIHLVDLAKALPDFEFHVAAWTTMSAHLLQMTEHHNIRLYPQVSNKVLDQLTAQCSGYLNINHGPKELTVIEPFRKAGKPLFSFASESDAISSSNHHHIIANNDWAKMVKTIKKYIKN